MIYWQKNDIHYYTVTSLNFLLISHRNIICRYLIEMNTEMMQIIEKYELYESKYSINCLSLQRKIKPESDIKRITDKLSQQ